MRTNQLLPCFGLFFCCFTATAQTKKEDSLFQKSLSDSLAKYLSTSKGTDTSLHIFEKVDVEASVDPKKWRKHLEKNLQPFLDRAVKQKIKPGFYTVLVRFQVEKDGSIVQAKTLNDPGYGLGKAAEEVVSTGPTWKPGEMKGRIVRSIHVQPITFVIQ